MTRFGIAAVTALAFTRPATPCDPRSYDPKDDAPREQVCTSDEQPGHATAQEVEKSRLAARTQVIDVRAGGTGSGSGVGASREEQTDSTPTDDSNVAP
jgi:hypothetical protein